MQTKPKEDIDIAENRTKLTKLIMATPGKEIMKKLFFITPCGIGTNFVRLYAHQQRALGFLEIQNVVANRSQLDGFKSVAEFQTFEKKEDADKGEVERTWNAIELQIKSRFFENERFKKETHFACYWILDPEKERILKYHLIRLSQQQQQEEPTAAYGCFKWHKLELFVENQKVTMGMPFFKHDNKLYFELIFHV